MISIHPYSSENFSDLQRLVAELQDVLYKLEPEIVGSGTSIGTPYTKYLLEQLNKKPGIIYLARSNTQIIGFVAGRLEHDQDESFEYLWISDIVVTEKERGKGIGSLLLQKIEEYAKNQGISHLKIASLVVNKGAQKLYRKNGFRDYSVLLYKKIGN